MTKVVPPVRKFLDSLSKESSASTKQLDDLFFNQIPLPVTDDNTIQKDDFISEQQREVQADVTFRNWTLAIIFMIIAIFSDMYSILGSQDQILPRLAAAILAFGLFYHAILEVIGIRVGKKVISFPYRPIWGLSGLSFWRSSRNLQDITEVGILRRWLWMERVSLNEEMPRVVLLFSSSSSRRTFMNCIKVRIPDIRFQKYR
jgi:hypothetical protein